MPFSGPKRPGQGHSLTRVSAGDLRGSRKHVSGTEGLSNRITTEEMKGSPLSGGPRDAQRVRLIKDFYSKLPDQRVIYLDFTDEIRYPLNPVPGTEYVITDFEVPASRSWIIDDVRFFGIYTEDAGPPIKYALIPSGWIESFEHFFFTIDNVVPLHLQTKRVNPTIPPPVSQEAYFPFLNETIGALEANFSLFVQPGQRIKGHFLNAAINPLTTLHSVGVRIRGWEADVSILDEILEQQR